MMKKVIDTVRAQAKRKTGYHFPIVVLSSTDKTGNYNKRFPRYQIVDWCNAKGDLLSTAGAATADGEVVDVTEAEEDGAKPNQPVGNRRSRKK